MPQKQGKERSGDIQEIVSRNNLQTGEYLDVEYWHNGIILRKGK